MMNDHTDEETLSTLSGTVAHFAGQNGEFGGLKCRSENQVIIRCKAANQNREAISVFIGVIHTASVKCSSNCFVVIFFSLFFSLFFLNTLQTDNNSNTVYVLG